MAIESPLTFFVLFYICQKDFVQNVLIMLDLKLYECHMSVVRVICLFVRASAGRTRQAQNECLCLLGESGRRPRRGGTAGGPGRLSAAARTAPRLARPGGASPTGDGRGPPVLRRYTDRRAGERVARVPLISGTSV